MYRSVSSQSVVYIILGYGVPADMLRDEQYNFYLKMAFNRIYDIIEKNNIARPLIVFSGGKTDLVKPYRRSEAGEMQKLFKALAVRPFLKGTTKSWRYLIETHALSTLENLINTKKLLAQKKVKPQKIYIFCEQTRQRRLGIISRKIFGSAHVTVVPIDFDISANRYLAPVFIARKEQAELKHSLRALRSSKNLKEHHKLFAKKLRFLRQAGLKKQPNAVQRWWEDQLSAL